MAGIEALLLEDGTASLLVIVGEGQLARFRLPVQVKSDFVMRNASPEECAARIRQLLWPGNESSASDFVAVDALTINLATYQVNVAGPSTMAALLNSLQMGFKTLAIQKRSGEVWQLLGAVKTEFDKFGQGLAKMQQRLRQTDEELDQLIGVRSRAISRKLRSVQSLDEASASALLEIDDMNELPKALSETSETSGKVGEY